MTTLAPLDDRICKVDDLYFPNLIPVVEEYDGSFNLTGLSPAVNLEYHAVRIGKQITINFKALNSVVKSGTGKIGSSNALPADLIPSANWAPYVIIDGANGGVASIVGINIRPAGDPDVGEIQIYNASALNNDYTNTAVISMKPCQITYCLQ
jgi:hypothetical protein